MRRHRLAQMLPARPVGAHQSMKTDIAFFLMGICT